MRGFVLCVLSVVVVTLLISSGAAFTSTVTWDFSMDRAKVSFSESEPGREFVKVEGFETTKFLDYPSIPYRIVSILIPQGERVFSVKLADIELVNFEKPV
ncbi:hypothetical protein J7M07_03540, partial [bacterium]|nr:hypothetical protein [bacterium]